MLSRLNATYTFHIGGASVDKDGNPTYMFYIRQKHTSGLMSNSHIVESVEDIPTIEEAIELVKKHSNALIDNILEVEREDQSRFDDE